MEVKVRCAVDVPMMSQLITEKHSIHTPPTKQNPAYKPVDIEEKVSFLGERWEIYHSRIIGMINAGRTLMSTLLLIVFAVVLNNYNAFSS